MKPAPIDLGAAVARSGVDTEGITAGQKFRDSADGVPEDCARQRRGAPPSLT